MTPYEIGILLHYHCTAAEYQDSGEPTFKPTMIDFVTRGLLRETNIPSLKYQATEACHVYCEALEAVRLPVQVWQIPTEE